MPTNVESITREHVEERLAETPRTRKANTAANQHKPPRAFFGWLVEQCEITASPLRNIKPPRIPEEPPPVLAKARIDRLLKVCAGKDFDSRRDGAIIRLLFDTGLRRGELAGLKVDDVDLDLNVVGVVGKLRRPRAVPLGKRTALALDRYLRVRGQHRYADLPDLWLGRRGAIRPDGFFDILQKRAKQAGIGHIHPRLFRHAFAHQWLSLGGQEQDRMVLTGWRSRGMLGRYGASAAAERARDAYRRLSPGDRL
jgi:site-specific recombinase XerD